jgi:predicted HTH transcriptional regulator
MMFQRLKNMDWENLKNNSKKETKEQKVKDSSFDLAIAIYELAKQIEDNNRLMKTLIQRIELLEMRTREKDNELIFSETDEKIINYIKEKGKVTAQEIKDVFNYKGTNAASARLNALCKLGILKKAFGGRRAYFFLNKSWQGNQPLQKTSEEEF